MPRKNATPSSQDALLEDFQALVSDTEKLLQHTASLAGEQAEALQQISWWDWSHAALKASLPDIRALDIDAFIEKYL